MEACTLSLTLSLCMRVSQGGVGGGDEPREALTSSLVLELQVGEDGAAFESRAQAHHHDKWVDMSADLTRAAAVSLDRARVDVVSVSVETEAGGQATTIHLEEHVVDLALSPCGSYIAILDESGSLSLYRCSGGLLFAYPILEPGSSDR
jgi:hypothetical protein